MKTIDVNVHGRGWVAVIPVSTLHGNAASIARRLRTAAGAQALVAVGKEDNMVHLFVDGQVPS